LAPLRHAGLVSQAKNAPARIVLPPPLAPMPSAPPTAQAKSAPARIVPPPPLAPMRNVSATGQAKSKWARTVPPSGPRRSEGPVGWVSRRYMPVVKWARSAPAVVQPSILALEDEVILNSPSVLDAEALKKSVMAQYDAFIKAQKSNSELYYATGHSGPRDNGVDPDFVAANDTVRAVYESLGELDEIKSRNRSRSFSDKNGFGSADIILCGKMGLKKPKMVYHIKLQDAWKL
jgi:hypothetical protein